MGAGKASGVEQEPLLPTVPLGRVAVAAEEAGSYENGTLPVRQWQGGLLRCCGACDHIGWGSFLLSKYLPCVAFGQNVKRSLRQSAWLHGVMYLALFLVATWLLAITLAAANHNVLAKCNGPLPGPHGSSEAQPLQGHSHSLLGDFLWGGDDAHHHHADHHKHGDRDDHDSDGNDGDHHHKHDGHDHDSDGNDGNHHHKHDDHDHDSDGSDGDHHHKHDDHDHDNDGHDGDHQHMHDDNGDHHHKHDDDGDDDHDHDKHGKHHDKKQQKGADKHGKEAAEAALTTSGSFRSVGSFVDRKAGPEHAGPSDHSDLFATPECHEAVVWYIAAWLALLASILAGVHYAARRRTLIRQQFGIAGSKMGDFCAWCWCGPCALCQETRTLWANNVVGGVWHGPTQYAAVSAPPAAPCQQFMTAEA